MTGTPGEENADPVETEAEAPAVVETPEPAKPATVEDLAQDMGWSPKDKWRGDPAQWKDAASFVKSTVEINKRISSELRETKDAVQRISRTSAAIAEREIAKREAELRERFETSVKAGDVAAASRASAELQQVRTEAPQTDALAEFQARNAWYGDDPEASDLAYKTAEMLARQGKDIPTQLKKAEEVVRKKFPALFGAEEERPNGKAPPSVAQPNTRTATPRPKVKGVADLPADAKKAGEDFVKRGRVATLQEYSDIYWQENA